MFPVPKAENRNDHVPRTKFPVLYSRFPLVIYFTQGSVYMSILISQFVSPSPPPPFFSFHLHLYSCPGKRVISLYSRNQYNIVKHLHSSFKKKKKKKKSPTKQKWPCDLRLFIAIRFLLIIINKELILSFLFFGIKYNAWLSLLPIARTLYDWRELR